MRKKFSKLVRILYCVDKAVACNCQYFYFKNPKKNSKQSKKSSVSLKEIIPYCLFLSKKFIDEDFHSQVEKLHILMIMKLTSEKIFKV